MNIREMNLKDAERLFELSGLVGWNQTLEDCRFLVEAEWCKMICVEEDGEVIGTAGAPVYDDMGFINMVIVHPDYRKRGIATAMIRHLLDTMDVKTFRLHATPAGSFVYSKIGFETTRTMSYFVAAEPRFPKSEVAVVPATMADLDAIAALDLKNSGMNRKKLLADNLNRFGKFALKIEKDKELLGFSLGRRGRKQRQIAAVETVDGDWEKAFALIGAAAPMEKELPSNIIFFDADKAAIKQAEQCGMERVRELIEMEYGVPGTPPGAGYHAIYGGDFG
jgi:N-acetylglutamate synthase-like GNAT family acetyltransferase